LVKRHNLSNDVGLVVVSVAEGEAADAAGITLGDVLVAAGGQPLARPSDLLDLLARVPDGGSIAVTLLRGGASQTVSITPRDRERGGVAA
jgi:S1-C subfamily serine protease